LSSKNEPSGDGIAKNLLIVVFNDADEDRDVTLKINLEKSGLGDMKKAPLKEIYRAYDFLAFSLCRNRLPRKLPGTPQRPSWNTKLKLYNIP